MTNISHNDYSYTAPISRLCGKNNFPGLSKVTPYPVGVKTPRFLTNSFFKGSRVTNINELSSMNLLIPSINKGCKAAKESLGLGSLSSFDLFSLEPFLNFGHEASSFGYSIFMKKIIEAKNKAADFLSCFSAAHTIPVKMLRDPNKQKGSLKFFQNHAINKFNIEG